MSSRFLDILARAREGALPSRQQASFPDFVMQPFTPSQTGFMFGQNSVPALPPAPAPVRGAFGDPNGDSGPGQQGVGRDVPDLEATPANIAGLAGIATAALSPMGMMGLATGFARDAMRDPAQKPSFAEFGLGQIAPFGIGRTQMAAMLGDPTASMRGDAETFGLGPSVASFDTPAGSMALGGFAESAFSGGEGGGSVADDDPGGFDAMDANDADIGEALGGFDDEDGFGDGGDDGGGDDKVICNELHRLGILPDDIWRADEAFGRTVPADVLAGYHWWAKPVVRLMKRSGIVVALVRLFALPWACHMAWRMSVRDRDNRMGRVLMAMGWPLCRAVGRFQCRISPTARTQHR